MDTRWLPKGATKSAFQIIPRSEAASHGEEHPTRKSHPFFSIICHNATHMVTGSNDAADGDWQGRGGTAWQHWEN
jgi:hypothetical protein